MSDRGRLFDGRPAKSVQDAPSAVVRGRTTRHLERHTDVLKLLLRTALATAALAVLPAATASAGVLVADAPNCDAQPLSQPFAPWLDPSWYTPLAGGSFEN